MDNAARFYPDQEDGLNIGLLLCTSIASVLSFIIATVTFVRKTKYILKSTKDDSTHVDNDTEQAVLLAKEKPSAPDTAMFAKSRVYWGNDAASLIALDNLSPENYNDTLANSPESANGFVANNIFMIEAEEYSDDY